MVIHLIAAVLLIGLTGSGSRGNDNPYKNAKVGDCATYKLSVRFGETQVGGTITQTITAKAERELTIKTSGKICLEGSNNHIPEREHKLAINKPFDPTLICGELAGGSDAALKKGDEGQERLKVCGKEYQTTWITYKLKANAQGQAVETDIKVWLAPDVPMGVVKVAVAGDVGGQKIDLVLEMTETANKK